VTLYLHSPRKPLWRGSLLKHRDDFTFNFECIITTVIDAASLKNQSVINFMGKCDMEMRGPFENFLYSPYYSKSELCGGAVTVSLSKYLPWQAMHFLQRSTHFSKTCCRPLITSKFLASELPFHGWKSPEITWGEIWTV
jgi:hypothetical protein